MPVKIPAITRFHAATLHLLISCLVCIVLISILLFFWYPSPYFSASGGWQGLQLVVLVDLVLGPCLTFIVYNQRKSRKELFFDLGLIGSVQLLALAWGIFSVYQQRPVAAVFWSDGFYTVPAQSLRDQDEDLQQLENFGSDAPVYVFAVPPKTDAEHAQMLTELAMTKIPPHEQVDRYQSLEQNYEYIRAAGLDIEEIITKNESMNQGLEKILQTSGTTKADNYYIPLISRYRNIILVFSNENELIGMLNAPLKEGPQ